MGNSILKRNLLDDNCFAKYNTTVYKGAAILAIMICHFAGQFGKGSVKIFTPLGGIGVAVFLILSAYGLNTSWNSALRNKNGPSPYKYWWRKRILAVWLPYFIVQIIFYWPKHSFNFGAFILDVICVKPLYENGWYLSYLAIWYVIFYAVRRFKAVDRYRIPIFAAASLVMFFVLPEIRAEQSLSFLCGILISERKLKRVQTPIGCAVLAAVGAAALAFKQLPAVRNLPRIPMNAIQLLIKFPLGLALILVCWFIGKKINLKPIYGVGLISYELYLLHGYFFSFVPRSFFGAVIFFAVSFGAATAFWYLMKFVNVALKKVLFRD